MEVNGLDGLYFVMYLLYKLYHESYKYFENEKCLNRNLKNKKSLQNESFATLLGLRIKLLNSINVQWDCNGQKCRLLNTIGANEISKWNFKYQRTPSKYVDPEAVVQRCSVKKAFSEIS